MIEDRGALFVRQEELEDKIKELTRHLLAQGQILADFGSALKLSPTTITFSNAPQGLGNAPIEILTRRTPDRNNFEWSQLETAASPANLARTIQELRQAQQDLSLVQQQLIRR